MQVYYKYFSYAAEVTKWLNLHAEEIKEIISISHNVASMYSGADFYVFYKAEKEIV